MLLWHATYRAQASQCNCWPYRKQIFGLVTTKKNKSRQTYLQRVFFPDFRIRVPGGADGAGIHIEFPTENLVVLGHFGVGCITLNININLGLGLGSNRSRSQRVFLLRRLGRHHDDVEDPLIAADVVRACYED